MGNGRRRTIYNGGAKMSISNKTYVAQQETLVEVSDKINNIEATTKNNFNLINSTIGTANPVPLDTMLTQLIFGTTFEYTNPGTYQLLIPANVNKIKVTACGGGGGASGWNTWDTAAAGGGGAAAIVDEEYDVIPQSTLNITVGRGGKRGSDSQKEASITNGTDGMPTIIGNLVTLAGGKGAIKADTNDRGGYPGAAGGPGGGSGGRGINYENMSANPTIPSENGSNGITGVGGKGSLPIWNGLSNSNDANAGGGGGGSLGNGGNGDNGSNSSNGTFTAGGRGAGGGGGGIYYNGSSSRKTLSGDGGDGYVKIVLILLT